MMLSVIAPCLNEEPCLRPLLARLGAVFEKGPWGGPTGAEAVFIDDGSTDGTWSLLEQAAREHPWVVKVRHDRNRGLAAAWRTGLEHARGRLVCILDADLQYQPEEIPRLLRELESSGADLVQGVRSADGRAGGSRYVVSRALSAVLNAAFGMRLRDNKSGFVICRREVLADLLAFRGRYRYWQVLLLVAAHARGYRIHEVETPFAPRYAGRSFLADVPLRVIAAVLGDLIRGIAEYRVGR